MKKILTTILLSVVILTSCGISEVDRENIEASIAVHNSQVRQDFVKDSLDADVEFQIENAKIKDAPEFKILLIKKGASFKNAWNNPYDIKKDYELTYDKYIQFCEKNSKDEKTFHKEL